MALPAKDQVRYWSISAFIFLLALWFLGDVLTPFVIGAAIAYFLDPVADRLETAGLSRAAATTVITLSVATIFTISLLVIVPKLIEQSVNLVQVAPEALSKLRTFLSQQFPSLGDESSTLRSALSQIATTLQSKMGQLASAVMASAMSFLNIVMLLVIVPVVAVYLLLDWDNMIAKVDDLLPRDHAPAIRELAKGIDETLSAFVRGMGTVSIILGSYYAISLMIVGLDFGLLVGFIAGLVTFIPYVGALLGGVLAIGLGLFQFWGDWFQIGLISGVFVLGQIIEGNVLTPKLVGNSVGLHPVWLLLALSIFGSLFGFIGMLVAVPVAASIGVIIRFSTSQYKASRLFLGLSAKVDD